MLLTHLPPDLPIPDAAALAHSEALLASIRAEIEQRGPMCFSRYMQLALYEPGLGYYSAGTRKFGPAGDFTTAPELSPLFSHCLAKQCQQVLQMLGSGDILELGAGSGVMAADILQTLALWDCLPTHYFILEVSAELKARQKVLLTERLPHLLNRIIWLDTLPEKIRGVIIANEVMDAMPVHRFYWKNAVIQELYIVIEQGQLAWHFTTPSHTAISDYVQTLQTYWENETNEYDAEMSLVLPAWVNSLSDSLQNGLILLIDYGFPRHEYYHPDRKHGTLTCHYQHRAHTNPLILPGLQDITAHVDFTLIAESASRANLEVAGFTTQAAFLLNCGLAEMIGASDYNSAPQQRVINQQIKQLTLPSEMGELFKVIGLTRDLETSLLGFALHDMRHRL